jgi:hypothetical protein
VLIDGLDDLCRQPLRQGMLLQNGQIGLDEDTTVEPRDRRRDLQRVHQHGHATRRASARDGELDARVMQFVDGGDGPVRQHFVVGDEAPIHIRQ